MLPCDGLDALPVTTQQLLSFSHALIAVQALERHVKCRSYSSLQLRSPLHCTHKLAFLTCQQNDLRVTGAAGIPKHVLRCVYSLPFRADVNMTALAPLMLLPLHIVDALHKFKLPAALRAKVTRINGQLNVQLTVVQLLMVLRMHPTSQNATPLLFNGTARGLVLLYCCCTRTHLAVLVMLYHVVITVKFVLHTVL
jgi:hypothetical protein